MSGLLSWLGLDAVEEEDEALTECMRHEDAVAASHPARVAALHAKKGKVVPALLAPVGCCPCRVAYVPVIGKKQSARLRVRQTKEGLLLRSTHTRSSYARGECDLLV